MSLDHRNELDGEGADGWRLECLPKWLLSHLAPLNAAARARRLKELHMALDAARQEGARGGKPVAWQEAAPKPVGWEPTHRHVKRGSLYRLVADAVLQAETPQADNSYLALYQGEDGKFWVRPADEFKDGRFEPLPPDHRK